jgi:hypothetical protein
MKYCRNYFPVLVMMILLGLLARPVSAATFRLARFSADVTIPLGHRCMGILPTKSKEIVDPLRVYGFVLLGADKPIVLAAFDWCEIRNDAYDQWRDALAEAAGTVRERVLVSSLHQHDAPVIDRGAQQLLDKFGLQGELYDVAFHQQTIQRVSRAVRESLDDTEPLTHIGLGWARVDQVASNRRVELPDGQVNYGRGSSSGGSQQNREADDGEIDPRLRTISFWNRRRPLLALHSYATHPMSYYGRGGVSWDFVGIARERRALDDRGIMQVYVSGCSGDVTAGKYNDGSPDNRAVLADRLYQAMTAAWQATSRMPLKHVGFRNTSFDLAFNDDQRFSRATLTATLEDADEDVRQRILAAMGLASLDRIAAGRQIDMPCVELGPARIVLFPGETFVGYQLMAQQLQPDKFVLSIGFGECWPGYIPTRRAFEENFGHSWRWVAPGSDRQLEAALRTVLEEK